MKNQRETTYGKLNYNIRETEEDFGKVIDKNNTKQMKTIKEAKREA